MAGRASPPLAPAKRWHLLIADDTRNSADHSEGVWQNEELAGHWHDSSMYAIALVLLFVTGTVLMAAVAYHCVTGWRWLLDRYVRSKWRISNDSNMESLSQQAATRISSSLPVLQTEQPKLDYVQEQVDPGKKVLRQTTLPTEPTRHQTFQRQLSHRLNQPSSEQFSVCGLERGESTIGLIQPELYKNVLVRQSSVESIQLEHCGNLHYSLKYDHDMEALVVKIFGAHDLPVKDLSGSSDPYIKVFLLPDQKKFQTKVHRKNLNPIFNETFLFNVDYKELYQRYLQFSVYDFDRFCRHDLIGHVIHKGLLESVDLSQEIDYTENILAAPEEKKGLGELMLTLCYLPIAGRLTVTVIKARNLKSMDINGSSDPYVKISLYCQSKRIKKRKTTVKRNTLYPYYNEALIFDLPAKNVYDVTLEVDVMDYDRIGKNELIGRAAIGSRVIGIGRDHWLAMVDNPRKPVAQWYTLVKTIPTNVTLPSNDKNNIAQSSLDEG